jgi:hypothetical protein
MSIPSSQTVDLHWAAQGGVASGAISQLDFAGNNAADPALGLGTTQPAGFDQYKALYTNYIVLSADATLSVTTQADTAVGDTVDVLGFTNTHNSTTNPLANVFAGLSRTKAMYRALDRYNPTCVIHLHGKSKDVFGRKLVETSGEDAGVTTSTTNPVNPWFHRFWIATRDGTTDLTLTWVVRGKMKVKFFKRIPVIDS